jgi:hypothetical protein
MSDFPQPPQSPSMRAAAPRGSQMSETTSANNEEFTPQPAAQRRGLGWPIVAAIAVGALLVGLGIGFLINQPRVSDAQDEADQAQAELASVSQELEDTQAQVSSAVQLDSKISSVTTVVGTVRAHLATCNPTSTSSLLFFPTTP